jgi:hypothetical protein
MRTRTLKRDNLTVTLTLHKVGGNRLAHFSATAELRDSKGRVISCGAMHEAILAKFPEVGDFVALHLADENGEPMHAEANGYYWLSGALGGLGEKYNGLNDDRGNSVQECLAIFASHVRISVEQADALIDSFKGGQSKVREQFAAWVVAQRPRWKAEADAAVAKYLS